jgi:predicted RNA-binding protein with PIN domain
MPYIIDGHNLIPKIPGLSLKAIDDEIQLIQLLQEFCRQQRKQAEVYFDNAPPGQPSTQKFGPVTARFIRRGTTADAAIRMRLRKLGGSARNWTVVTSDREVAAASRESHARVIPSDVFAQTLIGGRSMDLTSQEKDANLSLSPDDVENWLRFFGMDDSQKE